MFNKKSIVLAIALGITNLAHADLTSGLVAYYPFNGNANDESGNGNNGTVYGATLTADRFGNANSAYFFNNDGSINANAYITIIDNPSVRFNASFSISVWFNQYTVNSHIIAKPFGSSTADSYVLWTSSYDSRLKFYGSCDVMSIPIPSLNRWHHVAIITDYQQQLVYFYLDSVYQKSASYVSPSYDNNPVLIGADDNNGDKISDYGLNGVIDEVRIYNRALSAAEVQQLYLENTTQQLTITKTGTGSGTVTSNPAGINCGEDCSENYSTGSNVTLTATPDPVNTWGGWGGDCTGTANTCTVNMDKARNVTAAFNQILPPTATTGEATTVTQTSATLNGTVTSSNATAAVSFDFGTTNVYGNNIAATPAQVYSGTAVAVSTNTTDLTCGTTYHYRVKAVASSGTTLGIDQTFTTAACVVNSWLYPATHTVLKNQSFTLDIITKSDGVNIGNYEFTLTFDPNKLRLDASYCNQGICPGANALTNNIVYVNTTAGTINIIGQGGETVPGNDLQLLIVHLRSKLIPGATPVALTTNKLETIYGDTIGLGATGAVINISPGICGDADGNNAVNIIDALAIARKVVSLPPPPTVDTTLCDVNKNGRVDINDALMIARYCVGLVLPPEVCAIGKPL